MGTRLRRLLVVLACIKLVSICAMAFRPINPPHNWRQVDTVGVALRYWLRWTVEKVPFPEALYPAVLFSRDTKGIMAQEFPVLNVLMAPAFALGDHWGRIGAHLIFTALLGGLFYLNLRLWRQRSILEVPADMMILLLPCFSFMVPYWGRVIPDMVAALLVLAGMGFWWRCDLRQSRAALLAGAACLALGILIKPPAVVGAALLLLHPRVWKDGPIMAVVGAVALIPALLYYTEGVAFLKTLEEGGLPPFAVERKGILEAWFTVFRDLPGLVATLAKEAFNYGGLLVLGALAFVFLRHNGRLAKAGLVFLIAFALALTLAGSHVFLHSYYLAAIAPICALVFLLVWQAVVRDKRWQAVAGQGLLVLVLLGSFFNYLPMDHVSWAIPGRSAQLFEQCAQLKREASSWPWKQGLSFRSSEEAYPLLGLCFGEREGSRTAAKGFFFTHEALPVGCHAEFQADLVLLATCV